MIVSVQEMRDFLGNIDNSQYNRVSFIHEGTEQFAKTYCRKSFEETTHKLKSYDGTGSNFLYLDDYPINAVDRVSIGTVSAIKVKNTNAGSNASASVTPTGIRLVYNDISDTSVTFATNPSMSDVVSAINVVGNGWTAEIVDSKYNDFNSTELIKRFGANALNNSIYLKIPDYTLEYFDVNENSGYIRSRSKFPVGSNNVFVSYVAGYSSANMPKDLKEAIKQFVLFLYNRKEEEAFGLSEYRIGYNSVLSVFEEGSVPKEVKHVFDFYKKRRV